MDPGNDFVYRVSVVMGLSFAVGVTIGATCSRKVRCSGGRCPSIECDPPVVVGRENDELCVVEDFNLADLKLPQCTEYEPFLVAKVLGKRD